MNKFVKIAAAAAMTGALALAFVTPGEARDGRNAAAIGGFAAGAVVGGAIANSNNGYYNNGYYGNRSYDEPAYAYEPAPSYYYNDPSAPAYAYEPAPRYYSGSRRTSCGGSPGSSNYRPCNSSN
jgi:hypothetical protein